MIKTSEMVRRLEDSIDSLREENKKLRYKIRKLKSIRKMFDNCIAFAFLCFMCSWILCMLFQMITDVIMWFQFVRYI